MVGLFAHCNEPLITSLNKIADETGKVEMEEKFCSVALDIIGKSVFNYDFSLKRFIRHLSKVSVCEL